MQVMKCSRLENILFRRVEMMELLLTLGFFVELPIDLEKYRSESQRFYKQEQAMLHSEIRSHRIDENFRRIFYVASCKTFSKMCSRFRPSLLSDREQCRPQNIRLEYLRFFSTMKEKHIAKYIDCLSPTCLRNQTNLICVLFELLIRFLKSKTECAISRIGPKGPNGLNQSFDQDEVARGYTTPLRRPKNYRSCIPGYQSLSVRKEDRQQNMTDHHLVRKSFVFPKNHTGSRSLSKKVVHNFRLFNVETPAERARSMVKEPRQLPRPSLTSREEHDKSWELYNRNLEGLELEGSTATKMARWSRNNINNLVTQAYARNQTVRNTIDTYHETYLSTATINAFSSQFSIPHS